MKKKILVMALLVVFAILLSGCRSVRWLGSPVTEMWVKDGPHSWTQARPSIHGQISPPDVEMGLRSDGTVIWRENRQ